MKKSEKKGSSTPATASSSSRRSGASNPTPKKSPNPQRLSNKLPLSSNREAHGGQYRVIRKGNSLARHAQMLFANDAALPQERLWLETRPLRDWAYVEPRSNNVEKGNLAQVFSGGASFPCSLVNTVVKENGFTIESGRNDVPFQMPTGGLDDEDFAVEFYPFLFDAKRGPARNFLLPEVGTVGVVVATVSPIIEGEPTRVLIRTKFGISRHLAPVSCRTLKDVLQSAVQAHPRLRKEKIVAWEKKSEKIFPVTDENMMKDLMSYEVREVQLYRHYKIGVLYVAPGQKDENEIFGNVKTSQRFKDFLNMLGDTVELSGFKKYSGGLDTRGTNTTGSHSIYTTYSGVEIMFHVAPMLPDQAADLQRIEKKRHLGNDVVVIIFVDGEDDDFNPLTLTNQFNHVFIVVQPVNPARHREAMQVITSEEAISNTVSAHDVAYRVSVANKPGVEPFGPFIPFPGVFAKSNSFREFMLRKLINANRAAMYAQSFKANFVQTRRSQLESVAASYKPDKKARPSSVVQKKSVSETSGASAATATPASVDALRSSNGTAAVTPLADNNSLSLVVSMGKELVADAAKEIYEFDANRFRQTLHGVFQWTLSREELVSGGGAGASALSRDDHNLILQRARKLVSAGTTLADVREQAQQGFTQDEAVLGRAHDQNKLALSSFFQALKDVKFAAAGNVSPVNPRIIAPGSPKKLKGGTKFRSSSETPSSTPRDEMKRLDSDKSLYRSLDAKTHRASNSADIDKPRPASAHSSPTAPRKRSSSHSTNTALPVRPSGDLRKEAQRRALEAPASIDIGRLTTPAADAAADTAALVDAAAAKQARAAARKQAEAEFAVARQAEAAAAQLEEQSARARTQAQAHIQAEAERVEREARARQQQVEAQQEETRRLIASEARTGILVVKRCMIDLLQLLQVPELDWPVFAGFLADLGKEVKRMVSLETDMFTTLVERTKALLTEARELREIPEDEEQRQEVKLALRDVTLELRELATLM